MTEAIAALKAARELFSESPTLAILLFLSLAVGWLAKQGVLGVVARQKRQRRADIFDTYEKVKALDGLTVGDRTSLLAELRDAGVGLPRDASANEAHEEEEESHLLPVSIQHSVRAADVVLSAFGGVLVVGMIATAFFSSAAGFWMLVASKGDLNMLAGALLIGPGGLWLGATLSVSLIDDLTKRYPTRFAFAAERLTWLKRRTEFARHLAMLTFVVVLHVALLATGVIVAYFLAAESESVLGWGGAAVVAAVTAAAGVKMATEALRFLHVFETASTEDLEPETSGP